MKLYIAILLLISSFGGHALGQETVEYIGLQQKEGVWWLVSPKGKPFFSIGVNHAVDPNLWLQPYNKENTAKLFGEEIKTAWRTPDAEASKKWLSQIEDWIREWKFDAFGMHFRGVNNAHISPDLYYTDQIRLMKFHPSMKPGDPWPDVFSDAFVQKVDNTAKAVCEKNKNKPNLLGYYFTDEPAWDNFFRRVPENFKWWFYFNPWTDTLRKLPADAPGKQAWISVLKNNYPSPQQAAAVYGVHATTWTELEQMADWPIPKKSPDVTRDNTQMLMRIAEKWYAIQHAAVRKYDPNHLIFGDKHRNQVQKWLYPVLKKYVDVVVIQRGGWNPGFEEHFREVHQKTGKPILIGDGVPDYKQTISGEITYHKYNEKKIGQSYSKFVQTLTSQPYIVGYHHCGFIQTYQTPQRKNYATRSGFINPFGEIYKVFTEQVTRTNLQINEWHKKSNEQ